MPPSKRQSHPSRSTQNPKSACKETTEMENSITVASHVVPIRDHVETSSGQTTPKNGHLQNGSTVPSHTCSSPLSAPESSATPPRPIAASPAPSNPHHPGDRQGHHVASMPYSPAAVPRSFGIESSPLSSEELTVRQSVADIAAYQHDLDYCQAQLKEQDLTPQEQRTLQLRILDLNHQVRYCSHRIETILLTAKRLGRPLLNVPPAVLQQYSAHIGFGVGTNGTAYGRNNGLPTNGTPASGNAIGGKRRAAALDEGIDVETGTNDVDAAKRFKTEQSPETQGYEVTEGINTSLQRLGFWKCRLCEGEKYMFAGAGRTPAQPCKWPLKDISKMITHLTEMHLESTPSERCIELGAALAQNRGPFEYWLRRTRAQKLGDGSAIDECLTSLQAGKMPGILRRHSRAAANFPAC